MGYILQAVKMVKLPVDWSTFKLAVEGQITRESCVIQDGLPVFNCAPVPQKPPSLTFYFWLKFFAAISPSRETLGYGLLT